MIEWLNWSVSSVYPSPIWHAELSFTGLAIQVKWKLFSWVRLFETPLGSQIGLQFSRTLEWVAFPFSRGFSQPRNRNQVSHIAGRFFTSWATREALDLLKWLYLGKIYIRNYYTERVGALETSLCKFEDETSTRDQSTGSKSTTWCVSIRWRSEDWNWRGKRQGSLPRFSGHILFREAVLGAKVRQRVGYEVLTTLIQDRWEHHPFPSIYFSGRNGWQGGWGTVAGL